MLRFVFIWLCLYTCPSQAIILENLVETKQLESTLRDKKVGYYIGSFDPLHLGHEDTVKTILDQHLCDYVLIYPAWGEDEYKNRMDVNIRLEMLFTAFQDHPQVIVTKLPPLDLQNLLMRDNPDYQVSSNPTVTTRINGVEYIGVIGSDTALDMAKDKKKLSVFMKGLKIPEKYKENTIGGILALPVTSFIVSLRQGDSLKSLEMKIGSRPIIQAIETEYPDSSSTKIRNRLNANQLIHGLVSDDVLEIIKRYDLYKG